MTTTTIVAAAIAARATSTYFAMKGTAAHGDGVGVVLDSGPGVLPVPGAQLVKVIDDKDEETAGRRELGQHIVDHGLAVELRRRGRGPAPPTAPSSAS